MRVESIMESSYIDTFTSFHLTSEAKKRWRLQDPEQMDFESEGQSALCATASAMSGQDSNITGGQGPSGTTTIEFKGQTLNLDLGNMFSRFSQVRQNVDIYIYI